MIVDVNMGHIKFEMRRHGNDLGSLEMQKFKARVGMPHRGGQNISIQFDDIALIDSRKDSYLSKILKYVMMPKYYTKKFDLHAEQEQHHFDITIRNLPDFHMEIDIVFANYVILVVPDFFLSVLEFIKTGISD